MHFNSLPQSNNVSINKPSCDSRGRDVRQGDRKVLGGASVPSSCGERDFTGSNEHLPRVDPVHGCRELTNAKLGGGPCTPHSGGCGRADPACKGSPEQGMGREASWRRRLGLQRDGDSSGPGPVQPLCPAPTTGFCLGCPRWERGALDSWRTLWGPEGLEVIHGGSRAALGARAGSVAAQWSHPASALCWPWDFLT